MDARNKVARQDFDAQGRRHKETDRLTYPTEWTFDVTGNLLSLKIAGNQITSIGKTPLLSLDYSLQLIWPLSYGHLTSAVNGDLHAP